MKYLDSVRARVLAVALVPVGALAVVGLTLGGFLVHQGLQEKEFADKAVAATNSATYLVTNVQQERRRIDIGRPHADTARDKVVHDAPALEGLDAGLRTLVGRALDKDPRNRPTAQDLLAALVGNEHADPAQAAETINRYPEKYAHYLVAEAGGALDQSDLRLWRILNAPPTPYTRERFNDNYQWTLGWGLVPPGATYENTVDNRAWQ